jgi:hypothetical protein
MLGSMVLLLLLVVGGLSSVWGALFGAMSGVVFMVITDHWQSPWLSGLTLLGPGLAAIAVSRTPGGAVGELRKLVYALLPDSASIEARLGDLGLRRPFTADDVGYIDDRLNLPRELRRVTARG